MLVGLTAAVFASCGGSNGGSSGGGGGPTNNPPVAAASFYATNPSNQNHSLYAHIGNAVFLDASGSYDPDNNDVLAYTWMQTSGTPVTLSDNKSINPLFIPSSNGNYSFNVNVSDGKSSDNAAVALIIQNNNAPVAQTFSNLTLAPFTDYGFDFDNNNVPGAVPSSFDPDSIDSDGDIVNYTVDWGDGSPVENSSNGIFIHSYNSILTDYGLSLILTDDDGLPSNPVGILVSTTN